jgi:hypothetical protein
MAAKAAEAKRIAGLKPDPQPDQPADLSARSGFLNTRIGQIETKIDQTLAAYEKAKEPRDLQSLALALDKLWRTWALLTGHETPGIRRSKTRRDSAPPLAVVPREAS